MSRSLPQSAPPCKAAAGLEFENSDSNSGACTSAFSRRQFPPRFTTSEIHSRDDSQPNANVAGDHPGDSNLHHDDDLRNDGVRKDRRDGGDHGQGHRDGLGADDRISRAALRRSGGDCAQESAPMPLEHGSGVPSGRRSPPTPYSRHTRLRNRQREDRRSRCWTGGIESLARGASSR